jgi:hypothetical protein
LEDKTVGIAFDPELMSTDVIKVPDEVFNVLGAEGIDVVLTNRYR